MEVGEMPAVLCWLVILPLGCRWLDKPAGKGCTVVQRHNCGTHLTALPDGHVFFFLVLFKQKFSMSKFSKGEMNCHSDQGSRVLSIGGSFGFVCLQARRESYKLCQSPKMTSPHSPWSVLCLSFVYVHNQNRPLQCLRPILNAVFYFLCGRTISP